MLTAISAALDAYLQTQIAGNTLDIAWEADGYMPQGGRPYLRIALSSYVRVPLGPGPNTTFSERGSYTIAVVWPVGSGKAAAIAQADKIKGYFPRGLSLALAGQAPLIVTYASLATAGDDGAWLTVPVTVNWMTDDQEN